MASETRYNFLPFICHTTGLNDAMGSLKEIQEGAQTRMEIVICDMKYVNVKKSNPEDVALRN